MDTESHTVRVRKHGRQRAIVLQGGDMRGTLYAVYSFSEHVLDIPPLWFWTRHTFTRRETIEVPDDLDISYPAPHVRWRTWFPNDQDFLTREWKNREGHRDAIAETMLRLKLNAWDTGSVLDGSVRALTADAATAAERGMVVMSTHTAPLGARVDRTRWDRYWRDIRNTTPPPLKIAEAEALIAYWRHCIETIAATGIETIWTVTFRAGGDLPFWHLYDDAPETDSDRAAVLQKMLDTQVRLVRQYGGNQQTMRIPFYNEMSDFKIAGYLDPPGGENIIWNFVSARRDHYPPHGVENIPLPSAQPIGLYFNIQFTSTGAHVVQAEGPWKMEANHRFFDALQENPLALSVVNVGNIREFLMELEAHAAMMWDFTAFDPDQFVQAFSARYFGEDHACDVAQLFRDFYNAYWQQKPPDRKGIERQYLFHDLRYARAFREIVPHLQQRQPTREPFSSGFARANPDLFRIDLAHMRAADTLEAIIKGTAESGNRMARVVEQAESLKPRLPEDNRRFFNDHLLMHARFMKHINRSLHQTALALAHVEDSVLKRQHVTESMHQFRMAREVLRETEHGPFTDWYPRRGQRMMFRFYDIEDGLEQALLGTVP